MAKFGGHNIDLDKSDNKGMLNVDALIYNLPKAKKRVCEIKIENGFGSGFFCKIPYTKNNNILLPALITNHHVLSRDTLKNSDFIKIILDGESKTKAEFNFFKSWRNVKKIQEMWRKFKKSEENSRTEKKIQEMWRKFKNWKKNQEIELYNKYF